MLRPIALALCQTHTLWWLVCFHRFFRNNVHGCFSSIQNVFYPTPVDFQINVFDLIPLLATNLVFIYHQAFSYFSPIVS